VEIIEKVKEISELMNELQSYTNNLSANLQAVDYRISDLLHFIESEKLDTKACYRIVKELKNVRKDRRKIKNDMELSKTLNLNLNKLLGIENRQFLLAELNKTNNHLNNKYRNRIYTEEEIKELIGV
jgi:hypothetical protein